MSNIVIRSENLCHSFEEGGEQLTILKNINLAVHAGERVAIIGASGSGKSTLLHILGGLARPTSGEVFIKGHALHQLSEKKRSVLRNHTLGFIYQFHHLLPEFTALENVAMPLLIRGTSMKLALCEAEVILNQVGLGERLLHKPAQLSGGERQRVAFARALVTRPSCVLADEPTGNLDATTAQKVFDLMQNLNQQLNISFVIVTHDDQYAKTMDRTLRLHNGELHQV